MKLSERVRSLTVDNRAGLFMAAATSSSMAEMFAPPNAEV